MCRYIGIFLFTILSCIVSNGKTHTIDVINADTSKIDTFEVIHEKIATKKFTDLTVSNDSIKKEEAIQSEKELKKNVDHLFSTSWKSIWFMLSICVCAFIMNLVLTLIRKIRFNIKK